jgi:hypothetical protein
MFSCIILFTTSIDLGNHVLEMSDGYLTMVMLTGQLTPKF